MHMVEVEIDGKKVEVPEGTMLMEAANKSGTYIPHFCYHKKLTIAANCRMCLVDVDKVAKPLPACATPVSSGMIVRTQSEKAVLAQKSVMEFLLINHPLDCPICDQGGECQLQDIAVGYGGVSSRYQEEKRVVFHKQIGPLVSAQEMSRCIHCTRCVRFGQEIAGVMELGMANRGEHSEIMTFLGGSIDSELSGNMIDLCPVGALTSKPFRYKARTWEMARRKGVSAHDSLGSNLVYQVKSDQVLRVVPLENESINECWISDRDRFSYEGLYAADRIKTPMIKKGGHWTSTDWETALQFTIEGLKRARRESKDLNSIGCLISTQSTFEEMALAKLLMTSLGSTSIDAGLRHHASLKLTGAIPWLGSSIADIDQFEAILVVGSDLRNEQPLLATRIRQAGKFGVPVTLVGTFVNDALIPEATLEPVSLKNIPHALSKASVRASFEGKANKLILIGQQVLMSAYANDIISSAQELAKQTHSQLGFLGDGANWVGSFVAGLQACTGHHKSAEQMLTQYSSALVIINNEPCLDTLLGHRANAGLSRADFVVVASPFAGTAQEYADVILPITPHTETSGTFINLEGRVQTFTAATRPFGESRPGWKLLRVLGTLLGFEEFEQFNQSTDVLEAYLPKNISAMFSNSLQTDLQPSNQRDAVQQDAILNSAALDQSTATLELIGYLPIYHVDSIVRRATALQRTKAANMPLIQVSANTLNTLGAVEGQKIRLKDCMGGHLEAKVSVNRHLPDQAVVVPVGNDKIMALNTFSGAVTVQVLDAVSQGEA